MGCKRQIIELDSWCKSLVPQRVFMADLRTVQEGDIGDEVCDEAEHVNEWEVDGRSCGRFASDVDYGLRVEAQGPAEGVYPAE